MPFPTPRGVLRPVLALATLATVASLAQAQVELAADPITLWSELYDTDDALTKGLPADLDRDGRLDLVQLSAGGYVVLSSSPAERQHRRVLTINGFAASAVDMARLRADVGDALLTAGAHGVRRWTYEAATGQFAATVLRTHASGFQRVACAGRVVGAYRVAYAIAGDGRTVHPMFFYLGSGQEVFPLGAFDLGTTAGTIEAFDLQGDGIAELAVVTATSLSVRSYNGATVATYARSSTQSPSLDRLAVLQDDGTAVDRLAWVTHVGGQTRVRVLSPSGLAPALDLGAQNALQAASDDLDDDGLADLVLAPEIGPRVRWLRSIQSGTPRFSVSEPNDGELLPSPLYGQVNLSNAALGVGDFDRDGDIDVTLSARPATAGISTLNLFRGQSIEHSGQHPTFHDASGIANLGGGDYQLWIVLDPPQAAPTANVLRWRVWEEIVEPLGTAQDSPNLTGECTMPATWPHLVQIDLDASEPEKANWTVAFEFVHTQGPAPVIRPSLLVVGTGHSMDEIETEAQPGYALWGGISVSHGISGTGSGGVGQVPRVPPPPFPPAPPEPES